MIKFFRRIRQKLLSENKFSKYLIYAIGEIFLVVVGILIALNINNTNEKRKNDNEVNSILKQIRNELVTSIKQSEGLMKYYMKKDSLIYLVMTDKVSYEDYKNETIYGLRNLTSNYILLTIQNDGYLNLMNHVKNSPEALDSIIHDLKRVYVNDLNGVENANNMVQKIADEHSKWLKDNTNWALTSYFNNATISNEEIEFYLNSSYYKNVVSEYFNVVIQNQYERIIGFRYDAYISYKKITSYLNLDDDLLSNSNPFEQETGIYNNYLGNFKNETDTIKITVKNKEFVAQAPFYPINYSIIPVDTTSFILTPDYFFYLKFDKQGKVLGLTRRVGDYSREYSKVE